MSARDRLVQAGSLGAVIALWFLATAVAGLAPTLPTPGEVLVAFGGAVADPFFWGEVALSASRVFIAFLVAVIIAIPLGLAIGWNTTFSDLTFPALEVLRPIPPIAWFPALTILFYSPANIVRFIIFLAAFFPVLLNTIEGVRSIEEEYSQAAQSLGADSRQAFRHVVLPAASPSIYTGIVNAMGLAWVSLVAAELLSSSGLGYYIWIAFTAGAYPNVVVGMITVGVLGYASSTTVRWVGGRQLGWAESLAA
jgi:NitT/TauT family transport system permease protein